MSKKDYHSIGNCWQTPQKLFDELSEKYGPFDIDLAANYGNAKCDQFAIDYLNDKYYLWSSKGPLTEYDYKFKDTHFNAAFLNPPYSNPLPFIQKAWEDSRYCRIVLLVKVDPSTKWWSVFYNYDKGKDDCEHAVGPKLGCEIVFLPKRVQFDPPPEMHAWKEKKYCKTCNGEAPAYLNCVQCDGTAYQEGNKWYVKCQECGGDGIGMIEADIRFKEYVKGLPGTICSGCKGTGARKLAGPSFASAVIIMDRRHV